MFVCVLGCWVVGFVCLFVRLFLEIPKQNVDVRKSLETAFVRRRPFPRVRTTARGNGPCGTAWPGTISPNEITGRSGADRPTVRQHYLRRLSKTHANAPRWPARARVGRAREGRAGRMIRNHLLSLGKQSENPGADQHCARPDWLSRAH